MRKTILLVEDEEHDVIFMQMAMREESVDNQLIVARDGREAIAFLEGEGQFADRQKFPLPDLVLLDLKLPCVPGLEVLDHIRRHSELPSVPVIILSSSNQDSDVEAAYALGANGYIVKPFYPRLRAVVRLLRQYRIDADGPPPDCADWLKVNVPSPLRKSAA